MKRQRKEGKWNAKSVLQKRENHENRENVTKEVEERRASFLKR